MATYRKGLKKEFKKDSPEQVILRIIVGIISAVLVIVLFAFLYNLLFVSPDYTDFTVLDSYQYVLTQTDDNSDQIQNYIVYFYEEGNTGSDSIKSDVLKQLEKIEKDGVSVFLVDIANIADDDDTYKDALLTSIGETEISAPMIVTVVNGEYSDTFSGSTDVVGFVDDVVSGDYAPFN